MTPAAYGTMQWGAAADMDAARSMYEDCLAAGITHFDTAYIYTDGKSEQILGTLTKGRDDLYIATKAAFDKPATTANLHDSFDTSRKRLQRDSVDLFYLHRFDETTPLEQTFEGLAQLQSDGKIRHIGVSNFAAWQVMKAQTIAATFGTRIDAIQPMMNLVKRQVEVEILPMTRDQGIQIYAYSPLGGGLLTGKYTAGAQGRLKDSAMYATRYGQQWMHDVAAGLTGIAKDTGIEAATLAVAWLRAYAPDVQPILSARSSSQLAPSLAGMTLTLTDDVLAAINALSPPPAPATDRIEEA